MSLNSPSTTRRRRRHWSTSPPVVCVEKNPGPGQKKRGRKTRKGHQPLDHHLGEDEKKELKVLFGQGLGVNEIVRITHMKEDTVVRWHLRYDETGAMEAREHPGQARRSHAEKENHDPTAESSKSRPQKRRKQMDARDHSMVEAGIELKATETDIAAL